MFTVKTSFKIKKTLLTVSALALMVTGAVQVQAQDDVGGATLRNVLATGLAKNPEYGVVAASRRATDEELEQGRALFRPSIDLNGDTGFEHSDDPGTRGGADGDDTEDLFRYEVGATLTQLLFDGWESSYEVKRQKARVQSSAHRVRETAELVGLSIVEAYLEVLRQRQLLTISRQNVAQHIDIMEQIQDGVAAGRSTQADMEQVRARLAQSRATESSTRQALRTAEALYRREVGVESEVVQVVSHSPTLDIFAADIETAYAEAKQTKAPFYPQLDLQLNARQGEDLGGVEGVDRSASALVVANWNLYRGGGDTARVREFAHRHQESKELRADAQREIENDVRSTWASMVASGEQAKQFASQADANAEVVVAYKDQFSLDRRTLLLRAIRLIRSSLRCLRFIVFWLLKVSYCQRLVLSIRASQLFRLRSVQDHGLCLAAERIINRRGAEGRSFIVFS